MATLEQNLQRSEALASYLRNLKGTLGTGDGIRQAPDPIVSARELYVTGSISFEQFEARLDAVLSYAAA